MSQPTVDPLTQVVQRRGLLGVLILLVPIVSIVGVGSAYLYLAWLGWQGRDEAGEAVRIAFVGCDEAQTGVRARVAFMGLPDPVFEDTSDGFVLTTRLPEDPGAAVPETLAASGVFVVRPVGGGPSVLTNADVAEATVELPFLDAPHAIVVLRPDAAMGLRNHMESRPAEGVEVVLDDEVVYRRKNSPSVANGRLAVDKEGASDLERMQFAARTAAVLQGAPLPCTLSVASVTPVEAAEGTAD